MDGEIWIRPENTSLILRGIEIGALVDNLSLFTQHTKAMGKSLGDEYLTLVVAGEVKASPLAKMWRAFPNIYGYIKNVSFHHLNQLRLPVIDLIV
jgi:hypothetical protein